MKKQNKSLLNSFSEFKKLNKQEMSSIEGGSDLYAVTTYDLASYGGPYNQQVDSNDARDYELLGGMINIKTTKLV